MDFYQIVLPIFTVIFLLQVFVIQTWRQWKATGIKPYVFGNTDSPHDYCGKIYKLMVVGTWVSIVIYSFFPGNYKYLLPFWYMEAEGMQHVGFGLALLSFIWIIVAQNQMSKSWRIGIDYTEKTELKKEGLFRISRNPIFLGVIISYVGTFLIIPNALSFCTMLLTIVIIQVQVRLEEEYLEEVHGGAYTQYKLKTRRWI